MGAPQHTAPLCLSLTYFFFLFLCCLNKRKCFSFFVLNLWTGNIKSEVIYNHRCGTESKNEVQDSSMIFPPPTSLLGNCSSFPRFISLSQPHASSYRFTAFWLIVYLLANVKAIGVVVGVGWWLLCHSQLVCNSYSCSAMWNGLLQIGRRSKLCWFIVGRLNLQHKPEVDTSTHAVWWIAHFSIHMFSLFVWMQLLVKFES